MNFDRFNVNGCASSNNLGIMNVFAKVRRTNGQPEKHNEEQPVANFEPPPLTPVRLHGYANTAKIRLLDDDLCEEIRHLLPARLQLYDSWQLMYSLEQHGASLGTLYNRLRLPTDKRPGYIMVIKDRVGSIFGAYVNEAYKPTDTRRFYGNGECFLWKLKNKVKIVLLVVLKKVICQIDTFKHSRLLVSMILLFFVLIDSYLWEVAMGIMDCG